MPQQYIYLPTGQIVTERYPLNAFGTVVVYFPGEGPFHVDPDQLKGV